jgi:cobyric acid synthase
MHLPVVGTHLHGVLEGAEVRGALVRALARSRGFAYHSAGPEEVDPYDRLADVLEGSISLEWLRVTAD